MRLGASIDRHRLVVCLGTGGVGKTTVSAAIALGAALRGRRAVVVTIDPARQLARALGLDALRAGGERVPAAALRAAGLPDDLCLEAGMLDQKRAWDDFIGRHAPTSELRDRVLSNPFYQRMSTSFSGSTEYMAIEEMCRLDESGRYDLIVLDTPPASHAIDFLEAPDRIDRLLDREMSSWLARPQEAAGRGAWRTAGAASRFLLRRLEHAAGRSTLRDISGFFVAIDALLDEVAGRTRVARGLLHSRDTALVLVGAPQRMVLAETRVIADRLVELGAPLGGFVLNRVAPEVDLASVDALAAIGELAEDGVGADVIDWMRHRWLEAVAEARAVAEQRTQLDARLPAGLPRSLIAESSHDMHSLADLAEVAAQLW